MQKFNDLSQWHVVPAVPIFDEHQETRLEPELDAAGRPIMDTDQAGTPRPRLKQVVEEFDVPTLQRYADNCNRLVAIGKPPGLSLGHTTDNPDEKQQPETAGFGRNYRVAYSDQLERHVILHDEQFDIGKIDQVRSFPYRSVERWKKGQYFAPIACLRREPARNLGVVAYRKSDGGEFDEVYRYSMEAYSAMAIDPANLSPAAVPPPAPGAAPGAPPAPPAAAPAVDPDVAKFSALMEQYFSNPENCAKMSAAIKAPPAPPAPAAPPPLAPPAAAAPPPAAAKPDAPKPPEPDKNAAVPSAPSGTNTSIPGFDKDKQNMSATTQDELVRYQAALDQANARIAAEATARQAAEARIGSLEKAERVARYAKVISDLKTDGYPIDEGTELADCQDLDQAGFDKHVARIKRYSAGQRAPIGGGPIRLDGTPSNVHADEPLTKDQSDWAVKYQAEKGGKVPWDKVFDEARKAVSANGQLVRG